MTSAAMLSLGASSTSANWDAIDWQPIEANVRRLQMRIAKATREGRWGKVKALQWLLTHSFSAKLLAVRRCHRVRSWAFERLEPCEGKLSCTVLRGGNGRKVIPLPDLSIWRAVALRLLGSRDILMKPGWNKSPGMPPWMSGASLRDTGISSMTAIQNTQMPSEGIWTERA